MKIVMLEPLGVKKEVVMCAAQKFIDAGHEFVFCGEPIKTEEEKIKRAQDADILIIANSPLSAKVINAAKHLKMISVAFTGVDHVDMEACKAKNVCVCNAQGYATDATAELAVALMLVSLRSILKCNEEVRKGGSLKGRHNTLKGKTVGIIGTGAIGQRVAELTKAFGCRLIGYDVVQNPAALALGMEYTTLEELFAESDIVTLHAPLLESTKCIVNRERLALMKNTAFLINCARGPLVDSEALAQALNTGKIAGAAADVYETEPPIAADHPLMNAQNIVTTPHVGFFTEESLAQRVDIVCGNIEAWLDGHPVNVKL